MTDETTATANPAAVPVQPADPKVVNIHGEPLDLAATLEANGMAHLAPLVRAILAQWTQFAEAATVDKIAAEIFVAHYASVSATLQADPKAVQKMAEQARRAATIFSEGE